LPELRRKYPTWTITDRVTATYTGHDRQQRMAEHQRHDCQGWPRGPARQYRP
jgi:hypothetical protein